MHMLSGTNRHLENWLTGCMSSLSREPYRRGHPGPGQLSEIHINKIPQSSELAFKTTTHDQTIYTANFEGKQVYLFWQVDNFALARTNQELPDRIYDTIGQNYNRQMRTGHHLPRWDYSTTSMELTSHKAICISRFLALVLTLIGLLWLMDGRKINKWKQFSKPLPLSVPKGGNRFTNKRAPQKALLVNIKALQTKSGFSYWALLGEMVMYAYVTCRPDIGCAITLLPSKFGSRPSEYHYVCLKNVARYLRARKN